MAKVKDVCLTYGKTLVRLGGDDEKIVVLDADVSLASQTCFFLDSYPDRFVNVGIAEQNMIGIASGFAAMGFTPIVTTLAKFICTRALDQIINSIAYPNLNVNITGFYAGLSIGKDGATHQAIEDIGIMRAIPNMTIVCPGSIAEVGELVEQSFRINQPTYIRLSESLSLNEYPKQECQFGKGVQLLAGEKLTVITTGLMTGITYKAIQSLKEQNAVDLIHLHTLKPVDEKIVLESARKTGRVITVEEHNLIGGLGSIVSDILAEVKGVTLNKVGINDQFGRSGDLDELLEYYCLSPKHIASFIKKYL